MKKEKKQDISYAITKAGIGSIPLVGAAASELLSLIITPPLEKRRAEWMTAVGERIKNLEQSHNIDLASLSENEIFIDTVLQTTQLAIKTSEKEKIAYFRNALLNTAIGDNPDISEMQVFINLISDFTIWHIKILKLFDDPESWLNSKNIAVPNYMGAALSNILLLAYPELEVKREFYDLVWADLHRASLTTTSGLHAVMSGSGLMASRTSEFGKKFLKFITDKTNNK